ncbi:MAG: DUF6088 family protein [Hyphomicrobiales bacterium]|nr:DUF6088 family protein [Hyphomicrobiales bacterium]MCY4038397.1 DUF6088 family protein [Hyphomicrobiales bacterium]
MTGIADKILRRVRSKGRGKWVCTPKDFLDLGSRSSVDRALSRLAEKGDLRRIGHGFYDLPRFSEFLGRFVVPDVYSAVAAIVRRDGIRIMANGMACANRLRLTTAVSVKPDYITDGATRNVEVGGHTIHLHHAAPGVTYWFGKESAYVAIALLWLGPHASRDPRVIPTLRQMLSDDIKKELAQNSAHLPGWALPIVHDVVDARAEAA